MSLVLGHPVYDCIHLVLAQRLGVQVVTVDKRLLGVAPKELIVNLADWKR